MTTANAARMVFPFPYPSALYIAGANSGKPKPASERRHDTAANANHTAQTKKRVSRVHMACNRRGRGVPEAECRVKASMT